jgi:carboxyl-terminal processing protease
MQDEAGGLQIVDVVKNSPADKAGLQAGDHVLGLDGTAIKGSQIIDLRGKLKQASGTKVTLQVEGKAGKREVCLTLVELS